MQSKSTRPPPGGGGDRQDFESQTLCQLKSEIECQINCQNISEYTSENMSDRMSVGGDDSKIWRNHPILEGHPLLTHIKSLSTCCAYFKVNTEKPRVLWLYRDE